MKGGDDYIYDVRGCPFGSVVKNPPVDAGDTGSIPGLGRFHVLQLSGLEHHWNTNIQAVMSSLSGHKGLEGPLHSR